jgi:hypothetical protein
MIQVATFVVFEKNVDFLKKKTIFEKNPAFLKS